jgi:GT2 family glycosyltransferase/2-polyprenyl-3-methyl-5-hydroxy-6-metoxy-1,4-benzoquinol methylase
VSYYEYERPEVVALVPSTARNVLELGCASGALGAALKRRQSCRVTGIEYVADVAQRAHGRLDRVIAGDCETLDFDALFEPGEFDCLIAADVLEHLRDPEAILARLKPFLSHDATVVTSIPNVRNYAVLQSALEGNWTYQDAGILDRTHLRFFTRREIDAMFARLGFDLDDRRSVDDQLINAWEQKGRPTNLTFGALNVNGLSEEEVRELFVIQWLTRSRVAAPARKESPRASVIVLTYNQLEYTRECVKSVLDHTPQPFELIFVDNGSTDGTPDYLRTIPGAKVVLNKENLGFAAGNNQGLALASGRYIVLLNNDAIVTEGWLDGLLAPMDRDPRIGFVGPRSNYVAGPQVVRDVPYTTLDGMHTFAGERARQYAGQGSTVALIVGFCLALRSEVVQKIGGLDPTFGSGNYEDDDFCLRAVFAGWSGWIADDVFVHHYGHRTFVGAGIDWRASMRTNGVLLARKWSLPLDPESGKPRLPDDFFTTRSFDPAQHICPLPEEVRYTQVTEPLAAYYRGIEALASGDVQAAIAHLQAATNGAPNVADFHNALGAALFEANQFEAAVTTLKRAAELAPQDESIAYNLREALARTA